MQYQKIIEQLGYSRKEAKVYLASLQLGEAHVSDIAEKVKMPRSTVQVLVERLRDDGLMNFYITRRFKYWVAENPKVLLEKLKRQEDLVEMALPRLIALKKNARVNHKIAALQQNIGPLKEVADEISLPVLVTNKELEIQYTNHAWETQFGYTCAEVFGRSTRMLKSNKTPPEEYERLWKTLKSDGLFESDKIVDQKKDGTLFTLFTIIFSIHHGNRTFYVQILDGRDKTRSSSGELKEVFKNKITR